jgi:hypothetical protein
MMSRNSRTTVARQVVNSGAYYVTVFPLSGRGFIRESVTRNDRCCMAAFAERSQWWVSWIAAFAKGSEDWTHSEWLGCDLEWHSEDCEFTELSCSLAVAERSPAATSWMVAVAECSCSECIVTTERRIPQRVAGNDCVRSYWEWVIQWPW